MVVFGGKGMAKSSALKECAEYRHDRGDCVIDLVDMGRLENAFYYFPNPYIKIFKNYAKRKMMSANPRVGDYKPKGFDTVVHFPAIAGVDERLPVIFEPFRIPYQSLSLDELELLLGGELTQQAKSLLSTSWMKVSSMEEQSLPTLIRETKAYAKSGFALIDGDKVAISTMKTGMPLINSLVTLQRTGLLCGEDDKYALNLNKIMRDTIRIHSFTVRYMPVMEMKYLIYGWICKRIYNLRMNRGGYPDLSIIMREVRNLAPSVIHFSGQKISTAYLTALAAEGRDLRIRMFYDAQWPMQINKNMRLLPQMFLVFRVDRNVMDDISNMFYIDPKTQAATTHYRIGECTVRSPYEVSAHFLWPVPRSWIKKPKDDFIGIWKRLGLETKRFRFERPDDLIKIGRLDGNEPTRGEVKIGDIHKGHILSVISRLSKEKPPTKRVLLNYVKEIISSSMLGNYLSEMVDAGLIGASKDASDRRLVVYSPTDRE